SRRSLDRTGRAVALAGATAAKGPGRRTSRRTGSRRRRRDGPPECIRLSSAFRRTSLHSFGDLKRECTASSIWQYENRSYREAAVSWLAAPHGRLTTSVEVKSRLKKSTVWSKC